MNAQTLLCQLIDQQQRLLCASIPIDRQAAIIALLRARDRSLTSHDTEPPPDLVTGRRLIDLGGNKALQLCLESIDTGEPERKSPSSDGLETWAGRFLQECGRLAAAEQVLAHCESGFMRLVGDGNGTFDAWIATKRGPTSWRERADFDWWAARLARSHEMELRSLRSALPDADCGNHGADAYYRRLADLHLAMMAHQLGYPPDTMIGGCTIQTYCDVLVRLIAWALRAGDRGEAVAPRSEHSLVTAIASVLSADPVVIARAVGAFALDRENAAYHAPVPGIAAAPLVRLGQHRLVWSVRGLTTEPLLFLTRELKRRAAEEYHNAAHLREALFRQDLYALFQDKRFVTSAGRIELRRAGGDVRTDVDAVIFDRKSGTLALFELKSQDPFARSTAELARQRDNVLYANRQISGVLAWLKHHGADALLGRVDSRTARTFRVQKVLPFVLGRYVAHFGDGPEPDRRAAWGTWPQLLRLLDGQPAGIAGANPLASLHSRLAKDLPLVRPPSDSSPHEIALGAARLTVYPSFAAFQSSAAAERDSRSRSNGGGHG
jgi:hypothetical protein